MEALLHHPLQELAFVAAAASGEDSSVYSDLDMASYHPVALLLLRSLEIQVACSLPNCPHAHSKASSAHLTQ